MSCCRRRFNFEFPNRFVSGIVGPAGPTGPAGPIGPTGPAGLTPTLTIGTVTTGTTASASITGTAPNFVLNLVLPVSEPEVQQ